MSTKFRLVYYVKFDTCETPYRFLDKTEAFAFLARYLDTREVTVRAESEPVQDVWQLDIISDSRRSNQRFDAPPGWEAPPGLVAAITQATEYKEVTLKRVS